MESKQFDILVVDDKDTCIYVMKILSVKKDWQVDIAWNSRMALEFVRKRAYDAVVIGHRMPGMDGVDLCWRIRVSQPGVHAVFLTKCPTIDTVYPAIEAGAERVLAKPFDPGELVRVLEEQFAVTA
jgi:CheY-like chemotaxis protein